MYIFIAFPRKPTDIETETSENRTIGHNYISSGHYYYCYYCYYH